MFATPPPKVPLCDTTAVFTRFDLLSGARDLRLYDRRFVFCVCVCAR